MVKKTGKVIMAMFAVFLLLFAGCSNNTNDDWGDDAVDVYDFESCAAAGNPVMESFPMQCSHDGVVYVQDIEDGDGADDGGDGSINSDYAIKCEENGGNWVDGANECEGVSSEVCSDIGGVFNECASACRNNPEATVCTMQCVLVCQFNVESGDAGDLEDSEPERVDKPKVCTREYNPVCGIDGKTYANPCVAGEEKIAHYGECYSEEKEDECEANGGEYAQYGKALIYQCKMPTNDSGNSCEDGSECEGVCLSENGRGTCSPWDINFGCINIIEDGEEVTICID